MRVKGEGAPPVSPWREETLSSRFGGIHGYIKSPSALHPDLCVPPSPLSHHAQLSLPLTLPFFCCSETRSPSSPSIFLDLFSSNFPNLLPLVTISRHSPPPLPPISLSLPLTHRHHRHCPAVSCAFLPFSLVPQSFISANFPTLSCTQSHPFSSPFLHSHTHRISAICCHDHQS